MADSGFDAANLRFEEYDNNRPAWEHSVGTLALAGSADGEDEVLLSRETHRVALAINSFSTAIGVYSLIAFVILSFFGLRAVRSQTSRMQDALRRMDAPGVVMNGKTINMRGATLDTKLRVLAALHGQGLLNDASYEKLVAEAQAKG